MPFISTLFEQLITESTVRDFDWKCISGIQYLSQQFIKTHLKYLDIQVLVTTQSFNENFIIELIEELILDLPEPAKIIDTVIRIVYTIQKKKLSEEFKFKYPFSADDAPKNLYTARKEKLIEPQYYADVIESIVNYIQDLSTHEYNLIDFNALSCYRGLSESFIQRHLAKMNVSVLITHQKLTKECLSYINNTSMITSVNPILNSYVKKIDLLFLLELKKTFTYKETKKNNFIDKHRCTSSSNQ